MWFLARRVLADQQLPGDAPILVEDLRLAVNAMMKHAERAEWSTWKVGRDTIDTDDVLWLHTELQHTEQDALTAPRPPGHRRSPSARYLWQEYSPELTRAIASAVLRDALTGYQQLVETSFPRFGHALGLYSTLPVRVEGLLILPGPDAPADWPPSLEYTLHTDPAATPSAPPTVRLKLIEEPDVPHDHWINLPEDEASSVFRNPGVIQQEISGDHDRAATNLAYTWLARDLHAIGWLENTPHFD